jgi:hypothetical protein
MRVMCCTQGRLAQIMHEACACSTGKVLINDVLLITAMQGPAMICPIASSIQGEEEMRWIEVVHVENQTPNYRGHVDGFHILRSVTKTNGQ